MSIISRINRRFSRAINKRHRYDFPPANNGWVKVGKAPVWGDRASGTMFDPYAYAEGNHVFLVVSDRKNGTLIRIKSEDGEHWNSKEILLNGNTGKWDNVVNRGCLLRHEKCTFLWYTGQYNNTASIGCSVSYDNKQFTRVSESPILTAELPHEGVSVMNPCVIWDEEYHLFKMWYSAGENYEPDVICYAESKDGIHWNKHKAPVLQKHSTHKWEKEKVGGCQVIKNGNNDYIIYYIGYQNIDVARICMAKSTDGIVWKRDDNNLLISPSKNSWDGDATYKPTVVTKGDKMLMWYNGRLNNEEYIGLAVHN